MVQFTQVVGSSAPPAYIPQLQWSDYYSFQYFVAVIYILIVLVIILWKTKDTRQYRKIGIIMLLLIVVTLLGSALNQFNSLERLDKFFSDVSTGLKNEISEREPNVTLEIIEVKPPEAIAVYEPREMGGNKNTGGIMDEYQNLKYFIELNIREYQCKSIKIYLYDYVYYFLREYNDYNELFLFDFRAEIYLYIIINIIIMISGAILVFYITWKKLLFPNKTN